ncbi:MAG: hypothetical protein HKN04_15700, partial [Rhodothermaceae bacterium]|nr:hypothetical protein [Rhodothermaceae bacterium]
MRVSVSILLVAGLLATAGLLWPRATPPGAEPASLPRFSPEAGQRIAYDIDARTRGWARWGVAGARDGIALEARIHGALELHVLRTEEATGAARMAASLRAGQYLVNGLVECDSSMLSTPFTFVLSPRGTVADLAFTPAHVSSARRALASLVEGLQVTLPATPSGSWRAVEEEGAYRYEVAYQLDAAPAGGGT